MAETVGPLKTLIHRVRAVVSASRNKKAETTGLRVVHNPENAEIDIVAVHGLGGEGFGSWINYDSASDKPKSWLEDLLSADIPNARILTYGYISNGVSYRYIVRNVVYGRALDLANLLAAQRKQDKTNRRPLFFIAHSLGGWVVKRAMIISSESSDPDLKDIELSTCGVAFFGTLSPGRPSSPTPLAHVIRRTTSGLAQYGSKAHKALGTQQPHPSDMEWLEHQIEAFKAMTSNLPRLSFHETIKTNGTYVVEPRHSMTGSDGTQIPLMATHSELVGFHGRDSNYQTFLGKFREMVDTDQTSALMESKRITADVAPVHSAQYLDQGYDLPCRLPGDTNCTVLRRDICEKLDKMLGLDANSLIGGFEIINLWGTPGCGKSTIARHYAEVNREHLSFVFWIRSESWETVVASYLELANTVVEHYAKQIPRQQVESDLGFSGVEAMTKAKSIGQLDASRIKSMVRAVKDWLIRPQNNRWLLIFDNVNSSYDVLDFIPLRLCGRVILTSRDSSFCVWGMNLRVNSMTEEEALSLLDIMVGGQVLQNPKQAAVASRLVQQLEFHPQSIAMAGATIRNRGISVLEYLSVVEAKMPLVLIGSTIHQSPMTRTVLRVSAMLSASMIPVVLFSASSYLKEAPDKLTERLGEMKALRDIDHLDEVLQYLLDQNFIQTGMGSPDTASASSPTSSSSLPSSQLSAASIDTFIVEPEARKHVRGMLTKDETIDNAWIACNVCVEGIRSKEAQSSTLQEIHDFGRIMGPHAKACFDDWSRSLEVDDDHVAWHVLGHVCMTQGAVDQAIGCFELSLRQTPENMDALERIEATLSLCSLLRYSGQHRKSNEVLQAIGNDSIDQALRFRVALSMASATAAQGEHHLAKEQYEMLAIEQESSLGQNHVITIGTVQKLAATLQQLGKLEEAKALYRRVHISYQNLYGKNDPTTLAALEDLTNICKEAYAIEEAENFCSQLVDIYSRILGPGHPQTAYATQNLAIIDDLRRCYDSAKLKYEQALDIIAPTLGKAHPLYTTTMENMALSSRWHGHFLSTQVEADASISASPASSLRHSKLNAQKRREATLQRQMVLQRAFEDAERTYFDVLAIKNAARGLYSDEDAVATGSKLAEMYENEEFFGRQRAEKVEFLKSKLREGRRRGTM